MLRLLIDDKTESYVDEYGDFNTEIHNLTNQCNTFVYINKLLWDALPSEALDVISEYEYDGDVVHSEQDLNELLAKKLLYVKIANVSDIDILETYNKTVYPNHSYVHVIERVKLN